MVRRRSCSLPGQVRREASRPSVWCSWKPGPAGRPVVGVLDSGAEDAIVEGENGFLRDRADLDGLADVLVTLFEDNALADQMGAAGHAHAMQQTWEQAARRVAEIYQDVLAERGLRTSQRGRS